MPRNILGTIGKDYSESEELRSPYYGCTVAHVEPQVLKIYAKLLPQAQVAVFGEYEIMILFTYTDAKDDTTCFLQTLKKTFSELVDVSDMIHTLKAAEIADIVAQAEFHPQVACAREKKSGYIWNVDISGALDVMLFIDEPDEAETQTANEAEAAPDEKNGTTELDYALEQENACKQDDVCGPDDVYGVDINKYSQSEDKTDDSIARCWRIGGFTDLSFESLCEMKPEDIDLYVANDDYERDGLCGEFSDDEQ